MKILSRVPRGETEDDQNESSCTLRLRGGLTTVTRAPLQSHDLVLNVRIAIFEYICLLKSGDFGNFRKMENFEWEEIKIFILEVTNYNSVYLIVYM